MLMKINIELDDKEEILYRFLKDVCFKGEKTNKELINLLIKYSIIQIIGANNYEQFIDNLVERGIITNEERKILCQMN